MLEGFGAWLDENDLELPIGFKLDDEHNFALRPLTLYNGDYQKTYDVIMETDRYNREDLLDMIGRFEEVKELFDNGAIYGLGRDSKMRPIIVVNSRVAVDTGLEEELNIIACEIMRNYVIYQGMVPGRIEAASFIIDNTNTSLFEVPYGVLLGL